MFMHSPTARSGLHIGLLGLAAITLVGLAACGTADTSGNDTSATPIDAAQPAPSDPTEPAPTDPAPTDSAPTEPAPTDPAATGSTLGPTAQSQVDVAVQDLTERFDVAAGDITVVTVEEVTWRDASLGCPQKGMQYQQVLTAGTRIVLTDGDRTFNYHAGAGREPFYCARPDTPAPD